MKSLNQPKAWEKSCEPVFSLLHHSKPQIIIPVTKYLWKKSITLYNYQLATPPKYIVLGYVCVWGNVLHNCHNPWNKTLIRFYHTSNNCNKVPKGLHLFTWFKINPWFGRSGCNFLPWSKFQICRLLVFPFSTAKMEEEFYTVAVRISGVYGTIISQPSYLVRPQFLWAMRLIDED